MSKSLIDSAFLALITLIGLISGLYQIFSGPIGLGIILLVIAIISVLSYGTHKHWKFLFRVNFLSNNQEVYEASEHLLENSRHITFCGNLDNTLFEKFIKLSEKQKNQSDNNQKHINILNADPSFYNSLSDKNKITQILDMDAKSHNFNHMFYLYRQNINLLVGKIKERERLLLFFKCPDGDYNGIYIPRSSKLNLEIIENACPTVNILEQLNNVNSVANKSLDFWAPLKRGWYHPVFPPDDNPIIRHAWRNSLLSWFNSAAQALIANAGELTITWKIDDFSLEDAKTFEQWLKWLMTETTNKRIKVKRYMLISKEKYNTENTYKGIVDQIISTHLPPLPRPLNDNYEIYFINRDLLAPNLDDDFAFFTLKNGEIIAQDSVSDNKAGVEVLRVIFSKDYAFVKEATNKIFQLNLYSPKPTLNELMR